jgi:hypothetical protein
MFKENLDKLKAKINSFQINSVVKIKVDKLQIVNGNLYAYLINDLIKVYDNKTFKELANLKLPFKRKKQLFEILENETLIIYADSKLYFYKINLKQNELSFLHYLSEVYNFCYLKKRKEIFLLTELGSYDEKKLPWGMARSDILGNILFANKIKPEKYYEFTPPKSIEQPDLCTHVQSTLKQFNEFNGFNNDKYIINISGYIYDWYDYKINWGDTEIRFDISIFNADNLNELLEENHYDDLECCKITDNLFKFVSQNRAFYFNENNNKIEYIDNIFNYISKPFSLIYQNKKKKKKKYMLNENNEPYNEKNEEKNKQEYKYFNLNDNMFAVFDGKYYLYIIDLSSKNHTVQKIELNWIKDKYIDPDIKNMIYYKSDKKEYLTFSFLAKDKKTEKIISQIIHGIMLSNK